MNIELKAYGPISGGQHTGMEVAKIIRRTGSEGSMIATSFDFYMLWMLEREFPGLESGFAYDDDMLPDRVAKVAVAAYRLYSGRLFTPPGEAQNDLVNFLAETNFIGRRVGSTLIDLENSLIEADTVDKFHRKQQLVDTYTLYPLDTRFVKDKTGSQDEILERMIRHGADWMGTDDPVRLLERLRELRLR